eukprot:GFUD01020336.1.p1 GENE.GFUD01020336.1~~GFUD01020336.1.p1  ORF type:complete len:341 (-),score=61.96 GFUD01020336.1:85-1107(-)
MGSEKFCLRWNDFENNISSAFRELRDDKDFFDVTIACDEEQIQAHKVILSACSPFFRNVLRRNPHQHPLLYLKGVKHTDLQSVLNFMYHGEVNVAQEELNSFLAVAEDLRVKGLTQSQPGSQSTSKKETHFPRPKSPPLSKPNPPRQERDQIPPPAPKQRPRPIPPSHQPAPAPIAAPEEDEIQEVVPIKSEPREPIHNVYNPPDQLTQAPVDDQSLTTYQAEEGSYEEYAMEQYEEDQQYDAHPMDHSMQGQEQGKGDVQNPEDLLLYITKDLETKESCCSLCNFKNKIPAKVKNHLEGIHFPGVFVYSCDKCSKTFKGRNALGVHQSKVHSRNAQNYF